MFRNAAAMPAGWRVAAVMVALLVVGGCWSLVAQGHFGIALAGWWKFDEGVGLAAGDSSGAGNNGLLGGDVSYTGNALLGRALDFTGDSGAVLVAHSPDLEPATGTIQAWVKVATLQNSDVLGKTTNHWVRSGGSGSFSVYGIRITETGMAYGFIGNDDPSAPGPWTFTGSEPGVIKPGQWHHLALRWDGSHVAIFVDGLQRHEAPYVPVPGTGLSYSGVSYFFMGVGTWWGAPTQEFIGQLDDVRLYGRARPDVEIFTDFITKGHKPAKPPGQ